MSTRLAAQANVICLDALLYLQRRYADEAESLPCDLIFADPPYTTSDQRDDFSAQLLASPHLVKALAPDGVFVLEKSPRHGVQLETNGWTAVRQKRYGTTEVVFLRRADSGDTNETP